MLNIIIYFINRKPVRCTEKLLQLRSKEILHNFSFIYFLLNMSLFFFGITRRRKKKIGISLFVDPRIINYYD